MIPKIIHYCWFGRGDKPKILKKCIDSWQTFCPDYEIKEWNEDNFDVNISQYVKEAYEMKKWAFVSDYARFYVLNKYGGIYLDTDVEIIRKIDGLLDGNFAGFESNTAVATGLIMACDKDNGMCKAMLEEYDNDSFIKDDGTLNLRTVCHRVTDYLVGKGLALNGKTQDVDGYRIYAVDYFNPINMENGKKVLTKNTYTIHHYAGSWVKKSDKFRGKIYRALNRVFGEKFANKVRSVFGHKK